MLTLTVTGCGGEDNNQSQSPIAVVPAIYDDGPELPSTIDPPTNPNSTHWNWRTGPVINGRNRSDVGLTRIGQGWTVTFPTQPGDSVNYVQNFGVDLTNATHLRIKGRIEVADGARVFPQEYPDEPGYVSLMIQREGDDWSAIGQFSWYRFFRPTVFPIETGIFDISVPLYDGRWKGAQGGFSDEYEQQFNMTVRQAWNVAVVFGGKFGLGHGVRATGQARITMEEFEIVREDPQTASITSNVLLATDQINVTNVAECESGISQSVGEEVADLTFALTC